MTKKITHKYTLDCSCVLDNPDFLKLVINGIHFINITGQSHVCGISAELTIIGAS